MTKNNLTHVAGKPDKGFIEGFLKLVEQAKSGKKEETGLVKKGSG